MVQRLQAQRHPGGAQALSASAKPGTAVHGLPRAHVAHAMGLQRAASSSAGVRGAAATALLPLPVGEAVRLLGPAPPLPGCANGHHRRLWGPGHQGRDVARIWRRGHRRCRHADLRRTSPGPPAPTTSPSLPWRRRLQRGPGQGRRHGGRSRWLAAPRLHCMSAGPGAAPAACMRRVRVAAGRVAPAAATTGAGISRARAVTRARGGPPARGARAAREARLATAAGPAADPARPQGARAPGALARVPLALGRGLARALAPARTAGRPAVREPPGQTARDPGTTAAVLRVHLGERGGVLGAGLEYRDGGHDLRSRLGQLRRFRWLGWFRWLGRFQWLGRFGWLGQFRGVRRGAERFRRRA